MPFEILGEGKIEKMWKKLKKKINYMQVKIELFS